MSKAMQRAIAPGFVSLLIALALAPLGAHAGTSSRPGAVDVDTARANRFYRQGLAFYAENRYIEALRQFQNATFFSPEASEIRFAEGLCLMKLKELEKARDQFESVLDAVPDHARAHFNLGLVQVSLGDTAEARHHFMRAVVLDPKATGPRDALNHLELENWISKAKSLDSLSQYGEAADAWAHAATLDTARADLAAAAGVAAFRAGRVDTATAAFQRAMQLDGKDAKSAFNLGVAYEQRAKNEEALAAYVAASARDTSYADPCLNRGALLARLGRKEEARTAFERYLVLAPNSPRADDIRRAIASLSPPAPRKRR